MIKKKNINRTITFNMDVSNIVAKQLLRIRKKIKDSKNPIMFFDTDSDGGTSYLQLKNVFNKIKGYPLSKDIKKQKEIIKNIEMQPDLILIFDIPFLTEEFLKTLENKFQTQTIWLDHHPTNDKQLIEQYNITHFNPLNYDKNDNRPATYFSYLIAGTKDNLPLVVLGSVADFFLLDLIKELYDSDKQSFNILFKKIDKDKTRELFKFIKKYKFNNEETRKERAKWIEYLIYGARMIEFKNLLDFVYKLKEHDDTFKAFKIFEKSSLLELKIEMNAGKGFLFEDYAALNKKYKKILDKSLKEERTEKLFFYKYTGQTSFTKTLCEEVNYILHDTDIIFIAFTKKDSKFVNGSMRGKIKVSNIITESINCLDGNGGGHPYAAGFSVNKLYFDKFKERVFEMIENL